MYFYATRQSLANVPRKLEAGHHAPRGTQARPSPPACPLHPETSYWLGDANEMAAINTILIIVNSTAPKALQIHKILAGTSQLRQLSVKNKANLRLYTERSVNHFRDWLAKMPLPGSIRQGDSDSAMPLHLERIDWMPSPPLAPDDGPIDIDHLQRMTLGDAGLEREVLAMFAAQAASLIGTLATLARGRGVRWRIR